MTAAYAKMPKTILKSRISSDAKIVYLCLLDRQSLSEKNGWKDENGRTYIIFPISEVMEVLNCSKAKASKVLSELDGLIEKKRRGLCKPDIIYIKNEPVNESAENISAEFFDEVSKNETPEEACEKHRREHGGNSGGTHTETPDVSESAPNNNNINKNNLNKINLNNSSYHIYHCNWIEERMECIKNIKTNIEYDYLVSNYRKEIADEIVSVMANAVCSKKESLCIGGEEIPAAEVRKRLMSLDSDHIEYVYECLKKSRTKVKNMSAYLLACLYRASDVINLHYVNMVNTSA